jgi:hypothetical protein
MKKAESQPESQRKEKPVVHEELATDAAELTQLPGGPVAKMGEGATDSQAGRLGDPQMQTAQRQTLAAQIGRLQGNRYLQKVVDSAGRRPGAVTKPPGETAGQADEAAAVQAEMGPGRALDSATRSGVESALGQDFSQVEVHTDAQAAELSGQLDAEALTVGDHIAFGAGAYRPGTPVGDALIAHELAHVAQQRGGGPTSAALQREELERDANLSTVQTVAALWSRAQGTVTRLRQSAVPSLQTSLRIQRCSNEDRERVEAVRQILQQSDSGRRALELKDEYDVEVRAGRSGGGSYYDSSSNAMFIDPDESNESAALTFVHEMNHARYFHEGIGADAASMTREEYVNGMVEEESEGTVRSIETKIELEGTDIDVSGTTFPLETEYRQAHRAAVDAARAEDEERSDEELQRIGRDAGKRRVTQGFMNGEVVTSTTPQKPYPQYYGEIWDEVHAE